MPYTPRSVPWILDTDPGGEDLSNAVNANELNRMDNNQADANTRLRTLEGRSSALVSGDEVFNRMLARDAVPMVSGVVRLTYFTASKAGVSTQVRMVCATAAAATPTLCKIGLYTVNGAGDGTRVAVTANDTAMFNTADSSVTKPWLASYTEVLGQRYALAVIVVTAAATPTLAGLVRHPAMASEDALEQRIAATLAGQTDLPTTFAWQSLTTNTGTPYGVVLP